jgi:exopolysaccharide production protein ExoY
VPQLLNVLNGEMSLVGPRPDVPLSVEGYTEFERRRLEVLPGITGLWQISGRADLTVRQMFELDAQYVDRRSFCLDLQILLKTLPAVISRKGAG